MTVDRAVCRSNDSDFFTGFLLLIVVVRYTVRAALAPPGKKAKVHADAYGFGVLDA